MLKTVITFFLIFAMTLPLSSTASAAFTEKYEYDGRFVDVADSSWYYGTVARSYELAIMNGVSDTEFLPDATVTTLQAVILAARLHSLYHNGTERFETGAYWYSGAVQYAIDNQIVSDVIWRYLNDYITRAKFFQLVCDALPDGAFTAINDLPAGELDTWTGLPQGLFNDLDAGSIYAETIYKLYQAGIVVGNGNGYIYKDSTISRAETAAIMTRTADESFRITA